MVGAQFTERAVTSRIEFPDGLTGVRGGLNGGERCREGHSRQSRRDLQHNFPRLRFVSALDVGSWVNCFPAMRVAYAILGALLARAHFRKITRGS